MKQMTRLMNKVTLAQHECLSTRAVKFTLRYTGGRYDPAGYDDFGHPEIAQQLARLQVLLAKNQVNRVHFPAYCKRSREVATTSWTASSRKTTK